MTTAWLSKLIWEDDIDWSLLETDVTAVLNFSEIDNLSHVPHKASIENKFVPSTNQRLHAGFTVDTQEAIDFIDKHFLSNSKICIYDKSPNLNDSAFIFLSFLLIKRKLSLDYAYHLLALKNSKMRISDSTLRTLMTLESNTLHSISVHENMFAAMKIQEKHSELDVDTVSVLHEQCGNNLDETMSTIASLKSAEQFSLPSDHFLSYDEDFYRSERKINVRKLVDELQFWPPVQKQKLQPTKSALQLRRQSAPNLKDLSVFFDSMKTLSAVAATHFYSVMRDLGYDVKVALSAADATVRLCVDSNICSARHSFELQVDAAQVLVVAADCTGLLYAVHAFLQLVQMHCGQGGSTEGVLSIPAIAISDKPDFDVRAVTWSHRQFVQMNPASLVDSVRFLSKMRFSELHVVVDCGDAGDSLAERATFENLLWTLQRLCAKHFIQLVPVLVVESLSEQRWVAYL